MMEHAASGSALDRLGVELVHWPRDDALRRHLARAGVARLLLVEQEADPPTAVGVDEDWVRLPADERELWTRAERLSRLSAALDQEAPVLHDGRVLTHGAGTAVLSRREAVVVQMLLDALGSVVSRRELEDVLWPHGAPASGRALDALVERLRQRVSGLHLCIRSVRAKGFVIYVEPS